MAQTRTPQHQSNTPQRQSPGQQQRQDDGKPMDRSGQKKGDKKADDPARRHL